MEPAAVHVAALRERRPRRKSKLIKNGTVKSRVERVLGSLGRETSSLPIPTVESVARLTQYVELVQSFNRKMDLTAARSDDELVDLLVADAAIIAPRVEMKAKLVDIGSGAGAPGMPVALLRPDLDVTLVEPLAKRVMFLRTAVGRLSLPGKLVARVERARAEELIHEPRFGVALSRATFAPEKWREVGAQLVQPSGEIWVLVTGEAPPMEGASEDIAYEWPLTGAKRRAIVFRGVTSR